MSRKKIATTVLDSLSYYQGWFEIRQYFLEGFPLIVSPIDPVIPPKPQQKGDAGSASTTSWAGLMLRNLTYFCFF
jgi:hypothetical protein